MAGQAFNNHRLFSDYYLEAVVPSQPEWTEATAEATAARAHLRATWSAAQPLVVQHEGQTEEHWVRPVLRLLGYAFQVQAAVPGVTGTIRWPDYALFGSEEQRTAAEALAGTADYFGSALGVADAKVWGAPLDRASGSGPTFDRRNPNYQIDAYLRETDRRWGMLTNGRLWRLYSRDMSYRLDSFYEVDLVELLNANAEDFKYFWLFFRRAALERQPDAFVDRVRTQSEVFAESLSARVKERVYEALGEFINGFLAFPGNQLDPQRDLQAAYENSLILLYRILFVLYAEAHELLPMQNAAYRDTYSISRIKQDLASRLDSGTALLRTADNYYADLKNLFEIIDAGSTELRVPPYNGGLFDAAKHPFLTTYDIGDAYLARGLDQLARVSGFGGLVFVDYKTLQIRHLGDIYEGLLEYHPRYADVETVAVRSGRAEIWKPLAERQTNEAVIGRAQAGTCYLATGKGERRSTGSYYTPQNIVKAMVDDSVGRIVEDLESRLAGPALVEALLDIRVCDPAMGSGHFLVETVDHLARAVVRAGPDSELDESAETELQAARRRVVERCVYGVDPNPLAVELAKLSLWLATVARDRPLSFVDAHLLVGNSLIGTSIEKMASLRGADATQMNFVEEALGRVLPQLLAKTREMAERESDSVADVEEKERLLDELNDLRASFVETANLWTARHFGVRIGEDDYLQAVTALTGIEEAEVVQPPIRDEAAAAAQHYRFHHWELAFPEVFLNEGRPRGFDVVVTNPPYVSAIERRSAYDAATHRFWRDQFDSAFKAFDLYILFLELVPNLSRTDGFASLITPNKFLASPYAKAFREATVNRHALIRLIDASRVPVFEDPSVYPVITLFRAHDPEAYDTEVSRLTDDGSFRHHATHPSTALTRLPEYLWAYLLLEDADLLLKLGESHPQLEGSQGMRAVASTAASEAAAFGPELREEHLAPAPGWSVVATGTIDRYASKWGLSRLTHQGRRFVRPVLPFRSPAVSEYRRTQYWSPKLIFKKLCLRLEAVADPSGDYASMNTNFVLPGSVDLYATAALLHSSLMTWIYEGYFGALRMSGGFMQTQAPQLRVLPVPVFPEMVFAQNDAELDGLEDVGTLPMPAPDAEDRDVRLYTLLHACGKQSYESAVTLAGARRDFVLSLMDILGLSTRREQEPGFVLPRLDAILAAAEDLDATDLSTFWQPMRRTARALKVEITPARERRILEAVHAARAAMQPHAERMRVLAERTDDVVFALYNLSEGEIAKVSAGHEPPPGITAEPDD